MAALSIGSAIYISVFVGLMGVLQALLPVWSDKPRAQHRRPPAEVALLIGTVVIVMVVELLNTGIESAIDRIGPQWHDLSKRAKDMGSAAIAVRWMA